MGIGNNYKGPNGLITRAIYASDTIYQGDILYYDSGTGCTRVAGSDGNIVTMDGMAEFSVPAVNSGDLSSTRTTGTPTVGLVRRAGIVKLVGKLNDSFTDRAPVYWSAGTTAGTQQFTVTPGTNIVGWVCMNNATCAAITGDGVTANIPVELKLYEPASTIGIVN